MNPWLTVFTIVIVVLIVWLALLRNAINYKPDFEMHGHGDEQPAHEGEPHEAATSEEQPAPEAIRAAAVEKVAVMEASGQPDDLTIIEGIGPKINQLLQAAGIHTFAQLAGANTESLKAILEPAGLRFVDPGSWTEQARLISEGNMDAFEELTKRLRGGRQVN